MSLLTEYLNEILSWLQQNTPANYQGLDIDKIFLPGLTRNQVDEQVQDLPFKLPTEVYELYQWRNGMYQPDYKLPTFHFFPGQSMYPLEKAIAVYHGYKMIPVWKQNWLPLFNWEKGFYVVAGSEYEQSISPVLDIYFQTDPIVRYSSLTQMMKEIAERCKTGFYYIDEYGELTDEPR